jgi:hypothetical protein
MVEFYMHQRSAPSPSGGAMQGFPRMAMRKQCQENILGSGMSAMTLALGPRERLHQLCYDIDRFI